MGGGKEKQKDGRKNRGMDRGGCRQKNGVWRNGHIEGWTEGEKKGIS